MKTCINRFASFAFVERNLAQGGLFPYNNACSRLHAFPVSRSYMPMLSYRYNTACSCSSPFPLLKSVFALRFGQRLKSLVSTCVFPLLKSTFASVRDRLYCWLERGSGPFLRCLPFFFACILALAFVYPSQLTAQRLPRVSPKSAGMDALRLRYADEAIEQAIADKEIPGAVLAVVRHGKMAYLKAYGNKRVYPYTEPMSVNTVFDLASCSKSVSTAISAMILIERGKLRLLDPVERYIPGFKGWNSNDGRQKRSIRIVDLLTHTSGLPAYASVNMLVQKYGAPNPDSLMHYIAACRREFEPQTDCRYSCLNFITLQHVIEHVSGESLREFASANIFRPLGMKHTDYMPLNADGRPRSDASIPLSVIAPTEKTETGDVLCGQVHDPLARVMNAGVSGNAGLFSCAGDLAILCAALQNGGVWKGHRILSPLGVRAMRNIPLSAALFGRALGWDNSSPYASNKGDLFGPQTYGHTGYTGTSLIIDPESDTSVILLANAVHPTDNHSVVRLRSLVANAVAASIIRP